MDSSIARDPLSIDIPKAKSAYRTQLLVARQEYIPSDQDDAALAARLQTWLTENPCRCVGLYWPLKGEFDTRAVIAQWLAQSASHSAAFPVISHKNSPLEFWQWTPQSAMTLGKFGIPIPRQKTPLHPDLLLIPCLGFDHARLRLGYGGGYYDRTLAALSPRPITIGLSYEYARLPMLPREAHDIPLDYILSENACYA